MKICMFTPSANGGHALYTRELLTALADLGAGRGVSVSLASSVDLAPEHRTSSYPIHAFLPRLRHRGEFGGKLAWSMSRLGHYHRREREFLRWAGRRPDLDLVHFQECTPWLAPRLFRSLKRRGIAVVATVHNIFKHKYLNKLHKTSIDSWSRASWRECDGLIVHTDRLREELASFLGPGHPPIGVAPHGVWEVPGPPATAAVDGPLLFFGVIRPNKGLHVLLEAMRRLPRLRLIAAGSAEDGDYLGRLREAIGGLTPGQVELIDRYLPEDEAADLFGRSRLVILPYTAFASQSGVLHLALAHGRPVVATDVGALGESVRSWGIGEVVAPGDERALASAIGAALEPSRYEAAVEALGRVRAGLSWTRTAELTLDLYDSILRGPGRGRREDAGHGRMRGEIATTGARVSTHGHATAAAADRGAAS
jgi:glycosyltransferase involved in cell wall biosynthesis